MAAEGNAGQLLSVITLLAAAVVAVPLLKRIGFGSVLGYLAAGMMIGPFGLQLIHDPHTIIQVGELGVVMFLFVIGLELKPSHLWELRGQIFGLGSLQVVVCAFLLTFVGMAFGFPWQVSFVCAAGFVLTSTALVMQVLSERGDITEPRGQRIVSILLFEDLLIVPLLAVVAFLAPTEVVHEPTSPLWQRIGIAALSLGALAAIGLWLLNPLFRVLAQAKAREVMTAAALLVVLGAALLMEIGGLSMAMGAFVAGVLLSESTFRHQLEADIEPFRGLLLGLFFLGVGMALDLQVVATNWMLITSGLLALMLVKALCIYGVARLAKSSHGDALDRAVLMAQGGARAQTVSMDGVEPAHNLQGNVLIIGFGRVGQIACQAPLAQGAKLSIIEIDPEVIRAVEPYGFKAYYGDGARHEILHAAGAHNARTIIVCVNDKKAATRIVESTRHYCPQVKLLVRAFDREHALELVKHDADYIVRETFESALLLGRQAVLTLGASEHEADAVTDEVRMRDAERFALETAGGLFAGRALVLGNIERIEPPNQEARAPQ